MEQFGILGLDLNIMVRFNALGLRTKIILRELVERQNSDSVYIEEIYTHPTRITGSNPSNPS